MLPRFNFSALPWFQYTVSLRPPEFGFQSRLGFFCFVRRAQAARDKQHQGTDSAVRWW